MFAKMLKACLVSGGIIGCSILLVAPASATTMTLSGDPVSPAADYNFLLFENLRLSLTGEVAATYDDNLHEEEDDEEESFYLVPRLRLAIDWPITPHIKLGSGVSVGYRHYITGDADDNIIVGMQDLSTGLAAKIFVGNGVIRLSEQFSRDVETFRLLGDDSEDSVLNTNTISAKYSVPLNPYIHFNTEYVHQNVWTTTSELDYRDHVRDSIDVAALWQVNPQFQLGPYARYETINYGDFDHPFFGAVNDRELPEAGLTFLYRREAGFTLQGSLGYQDMDIDADDPFITDEDDGLVGRAACSFSTSRFTDHVFSISHDRNQALISPNVNYSEETRYRYAIASNIMPEITLHGDVSYVNINESDMGEKADLYQVGLGTSYRFTPKATVRLRYDFTYKDSDRETSEFDRNRFTVRFIYDF